MVLFSAFSKPEEQHFNLFFFCYEMEKKWLKSPPQK